LQLQESGLTSMLSAC